MNGVLYAWELEGTFWLSRFRWDNPNFAAKPFDTVKDLEAEAQRRQCEVKWQHQTPPKDLQPETPQ